VDNNRADILLRNLRLSHQNDGSITQFPCDSTALLLTMPSLSVSKVLPGPKVRTVMAVLISVSLALSQTPAYSARPRIRYGASVSRGVPVYSPAFAGTHCAYPRRDGQAESTWVAGYIPRWLTVRRQSPNIQVLTGPGV